MLAKGCEGPQLRGAAAGCADGVHAAGLPYHAAMILTLQICKEEPGLHTVRVLDGQCEIEVFQTATISEAIRDCGVAAFPDLDGFHIWCGHISIGTAPLYTMRHDAETLTQRLVSLHSQFDG
ncbi:hypothetical protein [Delftia tsuruhatensis]|uniref:hypothetical protein n=2 Tax=Delftia tsuruhatensis TaxID=180282 RepID=UPI001EF56A47|nr:hypothetical protein [Delftia tsuruhatensis]